MIKIIVLTVLFCLATLHSKSQDFNDTIISIKNDSIFCKIGLVNNFNIFYQYNPKKKKVASTYIKRSEVQYFSLPASNVTVMEQETPKEFSTYELLFTENNGIIYSSNINQPPQFLNGVNDLHRYLEKNIRVKPIDIRVFGSNYVTILYGLKIDSTGAVSDVRILEPSSLTGGYSYQSRFLETEIENVIKSMPNWSPAIVGSKKSTQHIYLPLKFKLEQNSIVMYSARYSFSFKNRK